MRPLWIIILLLSGYSIVYANKPEYHSVDVLEGEGVYALLRRYKLLESCNLPQFYELNQLSPQTPLIAGKKYILPVLIYTYDGKSIRSTLGIQDWDKAVAIKKYNEAILANGLRRTHYSSSNILWVPHHLLHCDENSSSESVAVKNPTPEKITALREKSPQLIRKFEIFGEKYEDTAILDNSLEGKVFYIVSGHGGPDPGAMAETESHTLCEDEYAYDVALRLCRKMIQHGATAYVIVRDENDGIRDDAYLECDKDETCYGDRKIPLNQLTRLKQRAHVINGLYASYKRKGIKEQYCLVLHVDSRHKDKRTDLYFYHHKNSRKSKKMSQSIYDVFQNKYSIYRANGQYNGSISSRNLYMVRETHPPTVYIEMGNLRNPKDQKRFLLNSNRQALADWITEGVINN